MDFLLLAAEMEAPLELAPSSGFGAAFVIVQLLFGVLFVVVPLGLLIYVVVLLRRMTAAVQGIEQHLASQGTGDEPSPL